MSVVVVILVVDTLRNDYAYRLEKILVKKGFVSYKNTIAPSPWTMPSHASIITGVYPKHHGAHETRDKKILDIKLNYKSSLHRILKNKGFTTYLLSANPLISSSFGYTEFDYEYIYDNNSNIFKLYNENKLNSKILKNIGILLKQVSTLYCRYRKWPLEKGSNNIIREFKKILSKNLDEDKFIFVNLMEVHEPYYKGEDSFKYLIENLKTNTIDPIMLDKWKIGYLNEVNYVIKKILKLLQILKDSKLFEKSLIIITSDHGQLLGEHNRIGHGYFLYNELIVVPLFIKYPEYIDEQLIKYSTQNASDKFISLTRIKSLVLNILSNPKEIKLYSDIVFSESYGIVHDLTNKLCSKDFDIIKKKYEKYKIAVLYKNIKCVFNVNDWKFEEIYLANSEIDYNNKLQYIKKRVNRFIKDRIYLRNMKLEI